MPFLLGRSSEIGTDVRSPPPLVDYIPVPDMPSTVVLLSRTSLRKNPRCVRNTLVHAARDNLDVTRARLSDAMLDNDSAGFGKELTGVHTAFPTDTARTLTPKWRT